MTSRRLYHFRPVTPDDFDLLASWQAQPHVHAWWDDEDPYDQETLSDARVSHWIVSLNGHPFAFMQDYTVHGWDDHHFASLPKGARGIDQYIGDPDMLGAGHGTAFIGERMRALFDQGAPIIATDPHPDNARAIAVYRKLGFKVVGPPRDSEWGLILPMVARR
ncbi:GNAT family N-acetyltransferase [Cognatiyoonia sp. IB215446]|uniref:GNAT family N-acetyltransferase n=1 Tax=Cognatiyoonia sp. IB215446 TaxID=3097355 RepID=UPI002A0F3C8B|nr:GNAT family N-acetyltransferase [Cognatiyoonia sp. IB215446]MDX8346489.1 GNAT family N-acetyltransferase [Cognatiyoonia sp. IB215446]